MGVSCLLPLLVLPAFGTVLPGDNPRKAFREESFELEWETPDRLNGKKASWPDAPTDMTLHSSNPAKMESSWDLLYPLAAELEFRAAPVSAFCRRWFWAAPVASSLYLVFLWAGNALMKDRKPFNLKTPLALWNLLLAVFSFIGAVRTVPHLLMMLNQEGFEYTVCRAAIVGYGSGATGLWVALFIFSKYFELVDTVFLVLRKKQVPFLHWYHHCSVLLYCWHAYVVEMPTGIYFAAMNYTVHAIMYFYYFLAAVLPKPPKWARLVTVVQITQMVVGIVITLTHLDKLTYRKVPNCDGHIPNLAGCLCMYASYFILFAQFFAGRYLSNRAKKQKLASKAE